MAPKLSWRLTLFAASGQTASSRASTAESEVIGSFSLRRIGANSSRLCIKAARTAALPQPVISTKVQTTTMPEIAPALPFPIRNNNTPTRNAM